MYILRAHERGIIFRNSGIIGNWLAVRCNAEEGLGSPSPAGTANRRRVAPRPNSAAGMDTKDIGGMDTVSRDGVAICNCRTANIRAATERAGACSGALSPSGGTKGERAVFFEVGKHEIMLRQQPIAFAELD